MNFSSDAISDLQERVLSRLGPAASRHRFYLGGGTAIALQLGHRRSVDFDWFAIDRMPDPMRLAQTLRDEGVPFETGQVEPGTLHGSVESVRVSFFEYRYPLLEDLLVWPAYDVHIAALDDLACMKLVAIAQRGARRDFLDLYALVRRHRPLEALVERYRRKYEVDDISHLLYALVYFDDAERERMPVMLWDVDWSTVKDALRHWVRDVAT